MFILMAIPHVYLAWPVVSNRLFMFVLCN